jgi:hypothetical protein
MSGQLYAPAALTQDSNLCTHWTEGWVGPRSGLGVFGEEKIILPQPGFETQTNQPIA